MNADPPRATAAAAPRSVPLLGTPLLVTDYQGLLDLFPGWAEQANTTAVDFCNTQTLSMRRMDPSFIEATRVIDYCIPDGMPLIWCLRAKGVKIDDRVYGPAFMGHALRHEKTLTHYFMGGSETTLQRLVEEARRLSGGAFRVIGAINGYFRPEDNPAIVEEINRLSPDVIWVGLGTPKQQQWIHDNKHLIHRGVVLAVGFAFDVNAGTKRDAPMWMQRHGLTWLFRLTQEPSRLWGRYLRYNSWFLWLLLTDLMRGSRSPQEQEEVRRPE